MNESYLHKILISNVSPYSNGTPENDDKKYEDLNNNSRPNEKENGVDLNLIEADINNFVNGETESPKKDISQSGEHNNSIINSKYSDDNIEKLDELPVKKRKNSYNITLENGNGSSTPDIKKMKMRVIELKNELSKRGLPVTGLKAELADRLINCLNINGLESAIKLDSSPPSEIPKRAISQSPKVIDGVMINPISIPKISLPNTQRKSGRGGKREGAGRKRKTLNNNNNVSIDKTSALDITISPQKSQCDQDLITNHLSTSNIISESILDRSLMDTKTN